MKYIHDHEADEADAEFIRQMMLKVLSQNKINSILAECQTPNAVKILSYTKKYDTEFT